MTFNEMLAAAPGRATRGDRARSWRARRPSDCGSPRSCTIRWGRSSRPCCFCSPALSPRARRAAPVLLEAQNSVPGEPSRTSAGSRSSCVPRRSKTWVWRARWPCCATASRSDRDWTVSCQDRLAAARALARHRTGDLPGGAGGADQRRPALGQPAGRAQPRQRRRPRSSSPCATTAEGLPRRRPSTGAGCGACASAPALVGAPRSRYATPGREPRCASGAGRRSGVIPLKTRILLADDHAVVRRGLRMVLEAQPDLQVVAEVGDGAEAVERGAPGRRRPGRHRHHDAADDGAAGRARALTAAGPSCGS